MAIEEAFAFQGPVGNEDEHRVPLLRPPRAVAQVPQLEDFFRKPDRYDPKLSPSGRHLAWLAPWERRLNVFVRDLATGDERRVTSAEERDVAGYLWAGDERIVYAQDRNGDEKWHLFGAERDGSRTRDLTPFEGVKCSIVDDLEDDDDAILFQMNRRNPEVFDVYRLDVHSGAFTAIAENPGP